VQETRKERAVRISEIGERALRASGMAKDNDGRRENPDIPYPSKRRRGGGEAEAITKAQWTGLRLGWCYLLLLCCTSFLP
jgi:hypothetical protein